MCRDSSKKNSKKKTIGFYNLITLIGFFTILISVILFLNDGTNVKGQAFGRLPGIEIMIFEFNQQQNAGSFFNDEIGNTVAFNNPSPHDVGFASDGFDEGAFVFDGDDSLLLSTAGINTALNTLPIVYQTWVKFEPVPFVSSVIYFRDNQYVIALVNTSGMVEVTSRIYTSDNNEHEIFTTGQDLQPNTWYHLAFVVEDLGSSLNASLFIDGIRVHDEIIAGSLKTLGVSGTPHIGAIDDLGVNGFNGLIDQFVVFQGTEPIISSDAPCTPPTTPGQNWSINGNVTCDNVVVSLLSDQNIIVSKWGNLKLQNGAELLMNPSSPVSSGIFIESNGTFISDASNIRGLNNINYKFIVNKDATFSITNSYIEDVGSNPVDGARGLEIYSNNVVFNNNIINESFFGLVLSNTKGVNIQSSEFSGNNQGVYLFYADDTVIEGNTFRDNTGSGIRNVYSYNVRLKDDIFFSNTNDISITDDGNFILINSSPSKINRPVTSIGTFEYRWYVDVHVEDNLGVPLQGVSVTIDNASSAEVYSGVTDAFGNSRAIVRAYITNSTDILINETPHTITVNDGSGDQTDTFNLSTNKYSSFIFVTAIQYPTFTYLLVSGITNESAIVTWTTDVDANFSIDYGITPALGTTMSSTAFELGNNLQLLNLVSDAAYYYDAISCVSGGGCTTLELLTFKTSSSNSISNTCTPPNSPLWVINGNVECNDTTIELLPNQNLTIVSGGNLTLNNTELLMNSTYYMNSTISFETGTNLKMYNSSILAGSGIAYGLYSEGNVFMESSTVGEAGLRDDGIKGFTIRNVGSIFANNSVFARSSVGLFANTTGSVTIENSVFNMNSNEGLYIAGTNNFRLINNSFYDQSIGILDSNQGVIDDISLSGFTGSNIAITFLNVSNTDLSNVLIEDAWRGIVINDSRGLQISDVLINNSGWLGITNTYGTNVDFTNVKIIDSSFPGMQIAHSPLTTLNNVNISSSVGVYDIYLIDNPDVDLDNKVYYDILESSVTLNITVMNEDESAIVQGASVWTHDVFGTQSSSYPTNAVGEVSVIVPERNESSGNITYFSLYNITADNGTHNGSVKLNVSKRQTETIILGQHLECETLWTCGAWSSCTGSQTRTCVDEYSCGTTAGIPPTSQSCTVPSNDNDKKKKSSSNSNPGFASITDREDQFLFNQGPIEKIVVFHNYSRAINVSVDSYTINYPGATMYYGVNITSNHPERMHNATIYFKVDNSWLVNNNVPMDLIGMSRLNNGVWERLNTKPIFEGVTVTKYSAFTEGFSVFAIYGFVQTETVNSDPKPEVIIPTQTNPEVDPEVTPETEEPLSDEANYLIWYVIGGILLLFVAGGAFLVLKKPEDHHSDIKPSKVQKLKEYVNTCRHHGVPDAEVKTKLLDAGWSDKLIDSLLENAEKPEKAKTVSEFEKLSAAQIEELHQFIHKSKTQGYDKKQIKEMLVSAGWSAQVVKGILK